MERICETRLLHLVTYENGLNMQETLVAMRQREEIPDQFLLLEHPPVITLGRGGNAANLIAAPRVLEQQRIRFFETTRGGDITYHGPGQVVGYPIVHLGEGRRDIRKYVTALEEVLIRAAADFGVAAERSGLNRGIWVGSKKLAAVGVRVARWVTSHGFAFNVGPDLQHFRLIVPCGLHDSGVTSLEEQTGRPIPLEEVQRAIVRHFAEVFERRIIFREPALRIIKVMPYDDRRVLLLHRTPESGGFWQPLTGSIEPGETPAGAAKRELAEETGQSETPLPMNLVQSFVIDSKYLPGEERKLLFTDETVFSVRLDARSPIKVDEEEHDAWGWFTFPEAYEKIRWTDDRESLEQLEGRLMESG